jgi:hypothetical protein
MRIEAGRPSISPGVGVSARRTRSAAGLAGGGLALLFAEPPPKPNEVSSPAGMVPVYDILVARHDVAVVRLHVLLIMKRFITSL